MTVLLTTNSVGQPDRFGFWREAVCDSYVQLDCESNNPKTFQGEIILNRLSYLSTSFVSGSNQIVRRGRRDIARQSDASFLISLQLSQEGLIRQSGREAHLRPGDFTLYSSTEKYSIDVPDGFKQLVVQIPREVLLSRLPNADMLTGIRVLGQSVFGSLAIDSVLRLVGNIDNSNEVVRQCMQDTIVDLFVTALASLEQAKYEQSRPAQQILLRANFYLQYNLKNPKLDRQMLAAAVGLSVRRLNELYQVENTSISATIRKMRLDRIAADLQDCRFLRESIGEIAFKWGIGNQESFARNFKAQFGVTPREYRLNIGSALSR